MFSKPDFDYYHKLDSDPDKEPAEFGNFRECVLPAVEARRSRHQAAPPQRFHRDHSGARPFRRPCGFRPRKRRPARGVPGDVFHHLLQVYYNPSFRGDATRWSPEDLFVASVSACHKLWYLHLCASAGVVVLAYRDEPVGAMVEEADGSGRFVSIVLHPAVKIAAGSDKAKAIALHHDA